MADLCCDNYSATYRQKLQEGEATAEPKRQRMVIGDWRMVNGEWRIAIGDWFSGGQCSCAAEKFSSHQEMRHPVS